MGDTNNVRRATALQGVLFDVDGTLIDSNKQHAASWREALHYGGYQFSIEQVLRAIGMGADNLLPSLVGISADSSEGEELAAQCSAIFESKYLSAIQPFPQARELLERVKDRGLKVGIATSAKKELLKKFMDIIGIKGLVDDSADCDSVENSKPDGDIIACAANKLSIPLAAVIMVGDTPYDIQAAQKVGVRTVCVTCGGWKMEELKRAAAVYESPADLVERFASSPLGQE